MPLPVRALVLAGAALLIAGSAEAESLTLSLGDMLREPTPGTIANVVVADPAIADVSVIDQHSVVIIAKAPGATEIMATDRGGRLLLDDRVVIGGEREGGRVTLYRGTEGSDFACLPRCRAREDTVRTGALNAAPAPSDGVAVAAPAPAPNAASAMTPQLHP